MSPQETVLSPIGKSYSTLILSIVHSITITSEQVHYAASRCPISYQYSVYLHSDKPNNESTEIQTAKNKKYAKALLLKPKLKLHHSKICNLLDLASKENAIIISKLSNNIANTPFVNTRDIMKLAEIKTVLPNPRASTSAIITERSIKTPRPSTSTHNKDMPSTKDVKYAGNLLNNIKLFNNIKKEEKLLVEPSQTKKTLKHYIGKLDYSRNKQTSTAKTIDQRNSKRNIGALSLKLLAESSRNCNDISSCTTTTHKITKGLPFVPNTYCKRIKKTNQKDGENTIIHSKHCGKHLISQSRNWS